jgi:phosphoribosylformylglycinamidine synthase
MSVISDVRRTTTSDLKRPGSKLVLVGVTKDELGGSVYYKTKGELGANAPRVDKAAARDVLHGVHRALQAGCALSAHDLSEGGLMAAVAEMAIGGKLGADVDVALMRTDGDLDATKRLFSESQSRLLLEVPPDRVADLAAHLRDAPFTVVGEVTSDATLRYADGDQALASLTVADAEAAWKRPLDLDGTLTAEGAR